MMVAATIRLRRSAVWSAACLSVAVTAALMGGIAAAQQKAPTEMAPKAANPQPLGKGKHGTLTIELLLGEPDKKNEHHPIAKAIVRIEGAEDPQDTNEKGRVKFSGIPTGKVALLIMPIGLERCRIPDVPVTGGDQVVRVLVEKSQKGTCTPLD